MRCTLKSLLNSGERLLLKTSCFWAENVTHVEIHYKSRFGILYFAVDKDLQVETFCIIIQLIIFFVQKCLFFLFLLTYEPLAIIINFFCRLNHYNFPTGRRTILHTIEETPVQSSSPCTSAGCWSHLVGGVLHSMPLANASLPWTGEGIWSIIQVVQGSSFRQQGVSAPMWAFFRCSIKWIYCTVCTVLTSL